MAGEKLDGATLISAIDAQISALQNLRNAAVAAVAVGALGQIGEGADLPVSQGGQLGQPTDLPQGAFNGKSIPACVKLYLSAAKRKQTTREIATALKDGGVESKAPIFDNVVYGALLRLKEAGDVLKFKDGWGLSEWYPASLRSSASSKPAKKKKANRKKQPITTKPKADAIPKIEPKPAAQDGKVSAEQQIIQFFKKHPGRELSSKELAEQLNMRSQTATFLLGKLAFRKWLDKTPSGTFKMGQGAMVN